MKWADRGRAARQQRLREVCSWAGLEFSPSNPYRETAWLPFRMFRHPRNLVENVLWDRRRSARFRAFDYWYIDPSDERIISRPRRVTCAVAPLPTISPKLRVATRSSPTRLKDSLGLPEVETELARFNERFVVETEDVKFALALLDRGMMDALLALPDGVTMGLNQQVMVLSAPLLPPQQVVLLFDAAVAIGSRIPDSLPTSHRLRLEGQPPAPSEEPAGPWAVPKA